MLWFRATVSILACALAACHSDAWPVDAGDLDREISTGDVDGDGDEDGADADIETDADIEILCTPRRWILTGEALNARDLGGTPLGSGAMVTCGRLYRGAHLANLTEQGCAEFARLGIRTVIDLRVESERLGSPAPQCVLDQVRMIPAPMPIPYSVSPENYIADLDAAESVRQAFEAFGDPAAYPIYNHCVYGRDRTGVLSAVILLVLGAAREDILIEYQLSRDAGLSTYPASLEAVLDEIELRGGVEAVLAADGVTPSQLDVLRGQAITL